MKSGTLARNALLNAIKQGCAVLFPVLSFAYCTRILGKEGLGIYSFSQSIVSYFILIAALGIPNYAIREGVACRDNPSRIRKFINQIFTINILSTILAYVLLAIAIITVPKLWTYKLVISLLSVQLILNTIGADWINTIFEDYLYLTIRYIVLQIVSFGCLLLFVHSSYDVLIYSLITMLANAGGNIVNIFYLKKQKIYPHITLNMEFNKHIIPIIILFANSVAGIIYLNSDITMIGFYLGEAETGIYTASSKVYTLVKTLINAIIMVTIPRFSYYIANDNNDDYKEKINSISDILLMILIPCLVGMIMEADKILLLVAGNGYETGVNVVCVLSFSLLFAVGACLFSYSVLIPNKKEKEFMIATIVAALINIVLNFFFIRTLGIVGAAITTLIAEIIVFGMTFFHARKIILPQLDRKSILSSICGGAIVFLVCYLVNTMKIDGITKLAISISASIIVYVIILFILKNRYLFYTIYRVKQMVNRK